MLSGLTTRKGENNEAVSKNDPGRSGLYSTGNRLRTATSYN
jgi:hypothetical protein